MRIHNTDLEYHKVCGTVSGYKVKACHPDYDSDGGKDKYDIFEINHVLQYTVGSGNIIMENQIPVFV